jgi:hypothetical protein
VFMVLDKNLAERAVDSMPDLKEFIGADGKLVVRVDKAMYGLIQSAKLWYNELTGFLMSQGFRKCISDDCILVKRMPNGESVTVVLYVDDILVMGKIKEDRYWVKSILEDRCKKITSEEGQKFTYLGMTIVRKQDGFQVCMRAYIEDILKLYGKIAKACVTPAKPGLFVVNANEQKVDSVIFHSIVAKLLYLGKQGRPDILLPVQFLCTRVKAPTVSDQRKLERVLGFLQLTKAWSRIFDNSKFNKVETYIDASFAIHVDGKSQSGSMVFLGNTLVHEGCRKQRLITRNSTEAELVAIRLYGGRGISRRISSRFG